MVFEKGSHPEISELEVAICRKQDVLWFDVSMTNSLGMHVAYSIDELGKVDVGHVLGDSSICFYLVEQISTLCQLHSYPSPVNILASVEELNDIPMDADMLVQSGFHLNLLWLDPAISLGIVLVDELDSEDRIVLVQGSGFLDAVA